MADQPLLRITGASKAFEHVIALDGVDLEIDAGEVVALVGDNGAGKSTLINAISGIHTLDAGEIRIGGRHVTLRGPQDAVAAGISTVYQDLALCDNLDVVANLFLGRERIARGPGSLTLSLDERSMEADARELLATLAVSIPDLRVEVGSMSGGQRQQVAVARSLLGDPRVVLLDEPTAALGVAQTAQVLDLVRTLRARGLGVLLVSHNLANIFDVADRIVVLRLGRVVGSSDIGATDREAVVAAITGAIPTLDRASP
jgi:D-xylose transport system ATP-binding protein